MDKTLKICAGIILFIFFIGCLAAPIMAQRKAIVSAKSTVKKALDYCQSGDAATGKVLWEDPTKFPDIYDLKSYKIQNAVTHKAGKNAFLTEVHVFIDFGSESTLPSGKVWEFKIKQKGLINTISDCYMLPES